MTMVYDDDDLLGPAKPRRGRPALPRDADGNIIRTPTPEPKPAVEDEYDLLGYDDDDDDTPILQGTVPSSNRLRAGVGITYLANIMAKEPRRLHNRLKSCPVLRYENRKGKEVAIYDFLTAMSFLLEPKVDLRDWIKSQSRGTLPPLLEKTFWEAERTRMRVMEEAGQYWRTEDVQKVFGRTAIAIKEQAMLWVENLPSKDSMSTEDYNSLLRQVREMISEVQSNLQMDAKQHQTRSIRAELDETVDRLNGKAFGIEQDLLE